MTLSRLRTIEPYMSKIFAILLLALCLLNACARAPQTPTEIPPTSTPIVYPATWTPVVTPLPPTATPRPPTRAPDADTLQVIKSFERTGHLTVYHSTLDIVMTDPTGSLAQQFPNLPREGPMLLLSMEGRQNPEASQWKMRGLILAFFNGNPDDEVEFVTAGDMVYLNGPMPLLGATEDRWYALGRSSEHDLTSETTSGFLLDLSSANSPLPTMHRDGAEEMDGKPCIKYRGDQAEVTNFFLSLDEDGTIRRNLSNLEGEPALGYLNLWVCDDGYIHKLEMGMEIFPPEQQGKSITVGFSMRVNDMNIIVPIETPQDAIPLTNPFSIPGFGDPNPAAKPTDQTA